MRRVGDAGLIKYQGLNILKEILMRKLLRVLSLAALLWIVAVLMGAQLVQALRDASQPAGLPYGLTLLWYVPAIY